MFEPFEDLAELAEGFQVAPEHLDPFHSSYRRLTPQQREQAVGLFNDAIVQAGRSIQLYDESGNLLGINARHQNLRARFIQVLHGLGKPEMIQHLNFLTTTLEGAIEVELQEGPLLNKLAQYSHYLMYLGECIVVCRDLEDAIALEFKVWKAENEGEFIRSAFQIQVDSAPMSGGKALVPTASALKLSDDRIQSAMLRDSKFLDKVLAFEGELSYIKSIKTRASNVYWCVQNASRTNTQLAKFISNEK